MTREAEFLYLAENLPKTEHTEISDKMQKHPFK
jgi:hypothetical protein